MEKKIITIELTKKSDHGASVRFDVPTPAFTDPLKNVYVNRVFPAINGATKIRVTIEVLN